MARFYSPEWVAAFNEAVADLDTRSVDTGGSLLAGTGHFQVAQVVQGGPDGDLVVTMVVDEGRLTLVLGPTPAEDDPGSASGVAEPDVTIVLSYEDAAAMSRSLLNPADAIAQGRVRVRGDLAVLVASQELLAAAGLQLTELHTDTSY